MQSDSMDGDGEQLIRIPLEGVAPVDVLGSRDTHLKKINANFSAQVRSRGNEIIVRGSADEVAEIRAVVEHLVSLVSRGTQLNEQRVQYTIDMVRSRRAEELRPLPDARPALKPSAEAKGVRPRTLTQKAYIDAIHDHDVVIAIGPAGTGKTYLAVACAVEALARRQVERIVLTRPAVEAGESLGFLPGDLQEKVDPYLRPLYDALGDMMRPERVKRLMEVGTIEVVPLAYMRGRTLNRSFVILDEGQHATRMQVKMFLTRLGVGSKAVITGDVTQVDLDDPNQSGLVHAQLVLAGVPGIAFVHFSREDVVRHALVQRIITAYEEEGMRRLADEGP